jgi:NAD+ diphosphatase
MNRTNFFAGLGLDRMSERRGDTDWLADLLRDPASRVVPVWRTNSLVASGDTPEAVLLSAEDLTQHSGGSIFLGIAEGKAYFAADLSQIEEAELPNLTGGRGSFVDLRDVGPAMDRQHAGLLAYARGLAYWHSRHQFCGLCGAPTISVEAGHVRRCTNEACKTEHYPRTDPAVIMLVTHGNRCLLAHNKRFRAAPFYSTLAGFVEPGESLEEAVAREVFEETGVRVGNVDYQSSQPWPFPASIMLGFRAEATSTDIQVDGKEIADAKWFDRDFLRREHSPDTFRLPRSVSIARRLIEDWVAEG